LALGSNLNSEFGSRLKNLEVAQLLIISKNIDIIDRSSYYETLSYPNKNDPKFVNCVIKINTKLSPKNLLNVILNIEKKIGKIQNKSINLALKFIGKYFEKNVLIPNNLTYSATRIILENSFK